MRAREVKFGVSLIAVAPQYTQLPSTCFVDIDFNMAIFNDLPYDVLYFILEYLQLRKKGVWLREISDTSMVP